MGFLRLYLALCVVAAHSNSVFPWAMHDGKEAVQIFFMISGFYMAMVLSNGYPSIKEFYISRWLRIFIPYYIVILLIIIVSLISGKLTGNWLRLTSYAADPFSRNGFTGLALAALSNLTIFFQDWVHFFQHDKGTNFSFTTNFWGNKSPLWIYLIIPPCWSVGIELTFYTLAPFINKISTKLILIVAFISILARLATYYFLKLDYDPWIYRFFPFELALFLAGMLGWRFYSKYNIASKIPICRKNSRYFLLCALISIVFFFHAKSIQYIGLFIDKNVVILLSYLVLPVFIATLFAYSKQISIDRFIGELSYPIYLTHFSLIGFAARITKKLRLSDSYDGALSALVTILVSLALLYFILQPFEKWRQKYLLRMSQKRIDGAIRSVII